MHPGRTSLAYDLTGRLRLHSCASRHCAVNLRDLREPVTDVQGCKVNIRTHLYGQTPYRRVNRPVSETRGMEIFNFSRPRERVDYCRSISAVWCYLYDLTAQGGYPNQSIGSVIGFVARERGQYANQALPIWPSAPHHQQTKALSTCVARGDRC